MGYDRLELEVNQGLIDRALLKVSYRWLGERKGLGVEVRFMVRLDGQRYVSTKRLINYYYSIQTMQFMKSVPHFMDQIFIYI